VDDALDLVLGKLDGVRPRGGYWMARCPAHEDREASLSVARGTEQPVIFKCHAGCERDAILEAAGLILSDISNPRDQRSEAEWTPHGDAIAIYDYTDEHGGLLFQVCRTAGKQFPQRRRDANGNWKWRLGNARRVPYRLPRIIAAVEAGKPVYIVEGEKDVHAIERAGATATTSPGGAGKWRDDYDEHFKDAAVVIIADRDEPGRDHAADVAAHLQAVARSVAIAEPAEGKDASDHLAAGKTLAELVRKPPAGGFTVIDLEPATEIVLPPTLICSEKLYLGGVHTITGPPDCGKTTLACWWMLEAIREGRTVLFLDEEGGRELITEKFQALGVQPGERIAYIPFPSRSWNAADIMALTQLVVERAPAIIAWDSSAAFLARAGLDENAAADVTRFYSQVLIPCARIHGAAVLVIDHDTKNAEPSRYARGSGAKLAATDVAYKVELIKAFSKTDDGLSKLIVTKDRRGWLDRHFQLSFTAGCILGITMTRTEAGSEFRPTGLMRKVSDLLTRQPGLSGRQIVDRVTGKEQYIRQALAALVDEGFILATPGPNRGIYHEIAKPFNE